MPHISRSDGVLSLAPFEYMLVTIIENQKRHQEQIMTALADLQAADAKLQAAVTQFLADVATKLAGSASSDDPAIEQVVTDINNEIAALQAGDPVTGTAAAPAAPAAPADPSAPAAPAAS